MKAKKKSKAGKWFIIGIVAIIILVIARFTLIRPKNNYESVLAKTGDITTYYSFAGNIQAKNHQSVMSEKTMQISKVMVKEGDNVKAGDVLLQTTTGDEIKAKIDGEVSDLKAEESATVMAGISLMNIVDYSNLEVNVKVDEYDISSLTVGKDITVKIDAADKQLPGKISVISKEGQVVNGVSYFSATIDLTNDSSLRAGMSAEVTLINSSAANIVTLPMTAIQFDEYNKPYVLKKEGKSQPQRIDITTGINDGTVVEIKSGVANGEKIFYPKNTTDVNMGFGARGGNRNSGGSNG